MTTTASAADTILKRCDEVLELEDGLNRYWERRALEFARDLQEAVEVFDELEREIREAWYQRRALGTEPDWGLLGSLSKRARKTLTTIAERGEGRK